MDILKKIRLVGLLIIMIGFSASAALAQAQFNLSNVNEIKVSGTSTIHDWEMEANEAKGQARIELGGRSIKSISSLNFNLKAEALKSGRRQMDRNAYSALETSSHPEISFDLKDVKEVTESTVRATGDLTISGQTRPVEITVNYTVSGNRQVRFSGKHNIKFSDFDIDPPTAMLGSVRTGDELELTFDVTYSQ
ncbi:MAG: YceI family protein [Saprospirales bacterium]|nr:MAG: YceI family protein [Saprospirales bacterium]